MEMLQYFLEFTFAGFWHFIGVVILLGVIGDATSNIISFPIKIVKNLKSKSESK